MSGKPKLFEKFPGLEGKIPWLALGDFPTPVQKLPQLGAEIGLPDLYCKCDDLTHPEYGGNKIRKLEFLLADVKQKGRKSELTLGGWGSNHVLATTLLSKKVGIKPLAVMIPQCAQEYARKNLLVIFALGCELNFAGSSAAVPTKIISVYLRHWLAGERPYFIWAGGSSPIGALGYVNAGLEISGQVKDGTLPEPDYIFCAVGSAGTFAGLVLGMKLAGLKTKVLGVRVFDKPFANSYTSCRLGRKTLALIRKFDPTVPDFKLERADFTVLHDYAGTKYARFTKAGMEAVSLAQEKESLKLDGTYTGKTLSAIIDWSRKGKLQNKTVLFLNSYNSRPLEKLAPVLPDWRDLPEQFHHCFLEPIPEIEE